MTEYLPSSRADCLRVTDTLFGSNQLSAENYIQVVRKERTFCKLLKIVLHFEAPMTYKTAIVVKSITQPPGECNWYFTTLHDLGCQH